MASLTPFELKFLVHTFVKRQTFLDCLSAAAVYQTWTTSLSAASLPSGSVGMAPVLSCGRGVLTCDGEISVQPLPHRAAANLCPFHPSNHIEMLCYLKIGEGYLKGASKRLLEISSKPI